MTKTALKKELHKAIDNIEDDTLLEAIYTILNSQHKQYSFELSEKDWNVVEERRASYEAGKSKAYTIKEVRKRIMKNLSK